MFIKVAVVGSSLRAMTSEFLVTWYISNTRYDFALVEVVLSPRRDLLVIINLCMPLLCLWGCHDRLVIAVLTELSRMVGCLVPLELAKHLLDHES